jgi:hypothetical protein
VGLSLHKPSKQTVMLLFVVAMLGIAAGAGTSYYLQNKNKPSVSTVTPLAEPPVKLNQDKSKENQEIPVLDIAKEPGKYIGLNVVAVGVVTKTTESNTYLLASDAPDSGATITIDKSNLKESLDDYVGKKIKLTGKVEFLKVEDTKHVLGIKASGIKSN